MAAENRLKQLFAKNTGLCKTEGEVYDDACSAGRVRGDVRKRSVNLSLTNGGRNYNGPG